MEINTRTRKITETQTWSRWKMKKKNNSSNKKKSAKKTVTWESGNIWQPVRQQKMQRTALISDDEDSQGDPEKKTKNRLLVH